MESVKCFDCESNCNSSMVGACIHAVNRECDAQNARVEIGNECAALREMVVSQQQTIEDLIVELEEERNAASTAANEALSMILRLQKDKAEVQMELRQFKRFAEEKMAHDQREVLGLEDMVYKREQVIQSLTCEIEAHRHRMMSYGLTESEVDGVVQAKTRNHSMKDMDALECSSEMYPPLKCNVKESQADRVGGDEFPDVEKYTFGETPHSCDQLKDLESRINQLEQSPRSMCPDGVLDKVVVNTRKLSTDGKEKGQEFSRYYSPRSANSFKKTVFSYTEENPGKVDDASEYGDEMSDIIYTVDSVQQGPPVNGFANSKASFCTESVGTPRETLSNFSTPRDLEIQKLYLRLHTLEADRESMRQAIISMGTEKAQVVLLKEIAQNLCKEMSPKNTNTRKQPETWRFSIKSIFKWIIPVFSWRRRGRRCRYMFGLSSNNMGLLVLLDRSPRVGYRGVNSLQTCKTIWSAAYRSVL